MIGPHLLRGEWMRSTLRYGSDNDTNAFGIGYQYTVSKRTVLYTSITRFNDGENAGVGGLGRSNSPIPIGLTRTGDNNLSEFVAGIAHKF